MTSQWEDASEITSRRHVRRMDFSDPQGGKGACDLKAASIRLHMKNPLKCRQ